MRKVTYKIKGRHGSIADLEWTDVPPFAVVTGENGAGKTHLLEALGVATGRGGTPPRHLRSVQKKVVVTVTTSDGQQVSFKDVFHAKDDWEPASFGSATVEQVVAEAQRLYELGDAAFIKGLNDPLYADWTVAPDAMPTERRVARPEWEQFEARLTAQRLSANVDDGKNLAFLFLAYEVLRVAAKDRCQRSGADYEAALLHLGEPPWEQFNRMCREADVGLEILSPTVERKIMAPPSGPYELRIRDLERGTVVSEAGASSGERIMLHVVAWRFLAEASGVRYDLILLDEPDAHLHPSLVRKFLRLLENILVRQHGARLIVTTHSPTTVALSPKDSVFALRRHGSPRIESVENVSSLIARLTDGLVAVDPTTRFVVLEGKTDEPFFSHVWSLLMEAGHPAFPGVAFFKRDGCAKVRETVRFLREWDFNRFFGILDRDAPPNENVPEPGLFVLKRNGVENYLFDPLNVWLCLWLNHKKMHAQLHQLPDLRIGGGHQLRQMPTHELQEIVNSVCTVVRPFLENTSASAGDPIDAHFANGLRLSYPRWTFEHDDHSLAVAVRAAFSPYPFPGQDVMDSFMTLNLVPLEFVEIFGEIMR
ncbi:ATP-binding protein (plasmid) [Caballeronia sp. NK8]|uniref:ATP-dependent nuclease n=1 Tax=Caballeronia sp. NK8 TaxID=140098 RepID=UPI001BB6856A|nr:ATP-binding protein [Caballeronia sp. NK8]BCQ29991.1 ATP-binding protein [Caballeronia sp. NK8]